MLSGWRLLEEGAGGAGATLHTAAGLAVVRSPRPLHYYCLFSHAIGADVVVSWRGAASLSWRRACFAIRGPAGAQCGAWNAVPSVLLMPALHRGEMEESG